MERRLLRAYSIDLPSQNGTTYLEKVSKFTGVHFWLITNCSYKVDQHKFQQIGTITNTFFYTVNKNHTYFTCILKSKGELVGTASGRCAWQYCNSLEQEQWIAFKPCLPNGQVQPESGSRPVIINKWHQGFFVEGSADFSNPAYIWSKFR